MRFVVAVCLALVIAGCTSKSKEPDQDIDPALVKELHAGEAVYLQYCIACHMDDGSGAPPLNPPLIRTSFVLGDKNALIGIVINGMKNIPVGGKNYNNVMPSFNYLEDEEIASVLTFIRNSFGNKADMITIEDVKNFKNPPAQNK
jgi:mono/diheme cytochrome c family protein